MDKLLGLGTWILRPGKYGLKCWPSATVRYAHVNSSLLLLDRSISRSLFSRSVLTFMDTCHSRGGLTVAGEEGKDVIGTCGEGLGRVSDKVQVGFR